MKKLCFVLFLLLVFIGFANSQNLPKGIRMASPAEVDNLKRRNLESELRSGRANPPLMVMSVVGNSFSGITAMACNASTIPADTMIVGKRTDQTGQEQMLNPVYVIQSIDPGTFCYPFDTGRKREWTEAWGVVRYEILSYDSSDETYPLISRSFADKQVPRYWSGDQALPKMISRGVSQTVSGVAYIKLEGNFGQPRGISVMIKDSENDAFYPVAVPREALTGNNGDLRINLALANFPTVPDAEIIVMISTQDGRSDQFNVRIKSSTNNGLKAEN
jgi:hypothetical protein